MEKVKKSFPLLLAVTLLYGMIHLTAHQIIRAPANEPQVQMSEDLARALEAGQAPQTLLPPGQVDLAQSRAPYVIFYDNDRKPLASNGVLGGKVPVPPVGVFAYTRAHSENRLTWQPRPGVRSAIVMTYHGGDHPGFVLVGRSLRETERLELHIDDLLVKGWLVTIAAVLGACLVF